MIKYSLSPSLSLSSLSPSPSLSVVALGFERVNYFTGESSEAAAFVRVEVLYGQLERSVAVWINSTEASTATPNQGVCVCVCVSYAIFPRMYQLLRHFNVFHCIDFAEVSRVLTFDAERTTDSIGIVIFDDNEREIVTETIDLQLSFVEEERGGGLLLLPNQATVNILDNDGNTNLEKKNTFISRVCAIKCTMP
jgi:hypothetical protein